MRELGDVFRKGQWIDEKKCYNEVTNSGVICPTCKKPIGSVEYVKIFKIKFYPAIAGFAQGEHDFAQKYSKRFEKW